MNTVQSELAVSPLLHTSHGYGPSSDTTPPPYSMMTNFAYPAFTFQSCINTRSLHSNYCFLILSLVVAIMTRSSANSNSQGSPLFVSSVAISLTIHSKRLRSEPWCSPTHQFLCERPTERYKNCCDEGYPLADAMVGPEFLFSIYKIYLNLKTVFSTFEDAFFFAKWLHKSCSSRTNFTSARLCRTSTSA